ncbi:MAG: heavy metal translocating P-type ATPase [Ruminococcaceae bacterium]|nr:heavy metal translocating P-type ATPase [Oscillospiraceae bacterium]
MRQYVVSGMSCAACSARVEKAVCALQGVTSCSVNLLTNSMLVDGAVSDDDIIKAVNDAGYGARKKGEQPKQNGYDEPEDTQTHQLKKRLLASLIFLVLLMYISMGHGMWGWKLPLFLENNHVAVGLAQLMLSAVIMVINQKFFISGFKALLNKSPNMDTLVALGSGASFTYSTVILFAMTWAQLEGDSQAVMGYMHELYFESAAMILTLITVGKVLESYSKGKTTNAIKSLIDMAPETATVITDGKETEVPAAQVKKGDIFVVRAGGRIPADGIVKEGNCAVDESALTGESIPVDKSPGDHVCAATVNQSGYIVCEAEKVGDDTALSQIIRMVSDAASTKAPIAKAADKVSGVFVPAVMAISAVTLLVWLLCGQSVGFALSRAISVLVISCPCALGLATPVAIMVGSGVGARNGILFKTAAALEICGNVNVVALDKTGTITKGCPHVTDIMPFGDISQRELMELAFSLEVKSEHPLAKAIAEKSEEMLVKPRDTSDFCTFAGNGLTAFEGEKQIVGGNVKFVSEKCFVSEEAVNAAYDFAHQGKTPVMFGYDGSLAGIIAVSDEIKEDSPRAVNELHNMGIHVVMLTGDNERTANAVKNAVGADELIAGVLPDGKQNAVTRLKKYGKVAMVGDGINDAPALTAADAGIAIGAGTDVAIDAADIVLVKSRLSDVTKAIRLSRATLSNIHQNLFWAFIYNVIGIPLAAGVWIPLFGWQLDPMFGAAAMSLSSFCVVTNALRLNFVNLSSASKDRKIKNKEKKIMEKTLKIKGMMCGHCEARVKKCLEAIDGVQEAIVSHEKGTAVVKLIKDVPYETLKNTVEAQDYEVAD